jgi:hypothetical protein
MVGPPSDRGQIAAFFSALESNRGFSNRRTRLLSSHDDTSNAASRLM